MAISPPSGLVSSRSKPTTSRPCCWAASMSSTVDTRANGSLLSRTWLLPSERAREPACLAGSLGHRHLSRAGGSARRRPGGVAGDQLGRGGGENGAAAAVHALAKKARGRQAQVAGCLVNAGQADRRAGGHRGVVV